MARCITASVASGVQSRGDGPVPPVVSSKSTPASSHSPISASRTLSNPSGIIRRTGSHGEVIARVSQSTIAGPPKSA